LAAAVASGAVFQFHTSNIRTTREPMAKPAWPGQNGFLQSGPSSRAAVPLSYELPLGPAIWSGSSKPTSTAG